MHDSPLTPWASFYVIVGTSATVLTGLMFVVMGLVSGIRVRRPETGIAAFNTPTVVHFCVALGVAAILSAPWKVLWHAGLLLDLCGVAGLAYTAVVARRIVRAEYDPVLEDWTWHMAFPLIAYVAITAAGILLPGNADPALFLAAAATMLMLYIGIHNAWDNVTFIVLNQILEPAEHPQEDRRTGHPGGGYTPASPADEDEHLPAAATRTGSPAERGT